MSMFFSVNIKQVADYNAKMEAGMEDKLFFLDKLPDIDVYVDYGCADGAMLQALSQRTNATLIGFDICPQQIELAKARLAGSGAEVHFFSDRKELNSFLEYLDGKKAIICSSLIHEVYSYGTENDVEEFWDFVRSEHFSNIVIRDMALDFASEEESIEEEVQAYLIHNADIEKLKEFTKIWGPISSKKNFAHWLLKYRYVDNWDREVRENYLPISVNDMLCAAGADSANIVHFEHYVLPYLNEQVNKDFGLNVPCNTHVKIILEN